MRTLRIMVVDDEPATRLGVTRALRGFRPQLNDVSEPIDYAVTEAGSGESAIAAMRREPTDIALVDYRLPGIDGLEVIKQIRQGKLDVMAIMITAYGSLDMVVTATSRGAYTFLPKPFTPDDLRRVVGQATVRLLLARQAERLAEERRRARAHFIRVLGHELKAPLAAVEGYLRIIHDRQAGHDLGAYDPMLVRSMVRLEGMRTLITDLLDMTRLEVEPYRRNLGDVDVVALAQKAMAVAAPAARERRIAMRLEATHPVELCADPAEVEIILNNLISNAVKYNRDGGQVNITVNHDDACVYVSVADTGIGIAEGEIDTLFHEFTRIRNAQTAGILGSGLGLSIVKRLAQRYGGSVSVESKPNVGSTFKVTLPRHSASTTESCKESTG